MFFAILAPVSARNPHVLRVRSGFCALPETKLTATITPEYNVSTSPLLRGCVSITLL
ncbi:L-asparaginase [Citrobacter freundii]|nr:L-asparaginase [Citrobacter freundii]QBI29404.1 L-asparaginase [Citrobacter sp. ABFQG]ASK00448.1 L-asparaginase [Citrobacter freundii]PCQ42595.1 L-asparaginase [Citrobacter freundii]PCQ48995.1 L-asparaginase [Citrobacter freundii]